MSGIPVFKRFDIYHRVPGGTWLTWDLNPLFIQTTKQPLTFTIAVSRDGVGDWFLAGTVSDNYWYFVDPQRWVWALDTRIFYKLTLHANGQGYDSEVRQAFGNLDSHGRNVAAAIVRKEAMVLRLKNGTPGLLWKRRHWGTRCPVCVDFDTGEAAGNRCDVCKDTGFVGGYFPAVDVPMLLKSDAGRRMTTEEPTQTTENQVKQGRTLACPWLDTNDVWANCQNDQHFFVQRVTPVEYRGVPVLFDPVELRLAPSTDIVYNLRRPGEEASSETAV